MIQTIRRTKTLSGFVSTTIIALMMSCGGNGTGGNSSSSGTDGGSGGPSGSPGSGNAPSAGYIVDVRIEGAQPSLLVFRADQVATNPLLTIPGGIVYPGISEGVGLMYCQSPSSLVLGCAEVGLITSPGAKRITIAGPQTGHLFLLVDTKLASDRLLVSDATSDTSYSLVSFAKDGSDRRPLKSGCTQLGNFKVVSGGVLFSCNNAGAGITLWYSDGLSEATELPGTLNAFPRATDGTFALYVDSTNQLMSRRTDGTGNAVHLIPESGEIDTFIASVDSTALVMTRSFSGTYDTWTVPFSGGGLFFHPSVNHPASTRLGMPNVTPDGRYFVTVYGVGVGKPGAFLVPVDPSDMNFVNLNPANANVGDVALFADGTALVLETGGPSGSGWQVVQGTTNGTPAIAGPVLDRNVLDRFWGTLGNWAIFQDAAAPYALRAAREDGLVATTLAAMGDLSAPPRLLPSGRILFVDSDHIPWIATPDLSMKIRLESLPTQETRGQSIAEGDRDLIVLYHPNGDIDTVMFDGPSRTILPVLVSATNSDTGYFIR